MEQMTPAERLAKKLEEIKQEKIETLIEKKIASLDTNRGAQRALAREDAKILEEMKHTIEEVQNKPVFTGFAFSKIVEDIVAIASALQYMKGDLRDQIPTGYYEVFDDEIRTNILEAYGRLPYLAEPTLIEVNGELVNLDPEASNRAETGIRPSADSLEEYTSMVAIDLGLLSTINVTKAQVDKAWEQAVSKLNKQKVLAEYAEQLEA